MANGGVGGVVGVSSRERGACRHRAGRGTRLDSAAVSVRLQVPFWGRDSVAGVHERLPTCYFGRWEGLLHGESPVRIMSIMWKQVSSWFRSEQLWKLS